MNNINLSSKNSRNIKKDKIIVRSLSIICLVGGFQIATQYFAHQFNYQPQLGSHFFSIHEPWAILLWANNWYGEYSGIFDLAAGFGILFSSIGLILVLVIKMVLANSSRTNQGLHGSARWADKKDIVAAGLLATGSYSKSNNNDAVYVGGWRDNSSKTHYLKHSGPEHVLCYAPTRSGKGVSLVIPTLLSWTQSAVITDLKGELWALTSGWRKHHAKNKVLRFDPASLMSSHWNPLDEIQTGSGTEVADVQNLTTLIVDPDGKGLQTHWQKTSQALLVGVILHVLYKSEREGTPATLSTVDSILSDPDRDIRELWMEMAMQDYLDGKSHPVIAASARDMPCHSGRKKIGSEKLIGEIWGIGRRLAPKLHEIGIKTVLDLKTASPSQLRVRFSVVMEKTIREINGTACIELEEINPPKKQIVSSRSFGIPVSDLASLEESVSLYISRAAEKLRGQQSYAGSVHVNIRTSPFNEKEPYYANGMTIALPRQTDDTRLLTKVALWGLRKIYHPGYKYQKAGVMLSELVPRQYRQLDLFGTISVSDNQSSKLMSVMDQINARMGRGTLKLTSEGYKQPWRMKQGNKSPNYTTNWDDLICVTK